MTKPVSATAPDGAVARSLYVKIEFASSSIALIIPMTSVEPSTIDILGS